MSVSKKQVIIDGYPKIKEWLKAGLYESQIYKNLGVGKTTWEKYKKELPELMTILKGGVKSQVEIVENSGYKLATGYNYVEQEVVKGKEIYYDDRGNKCERPYYTVVDVVKHKPAQIEAVKFFLINKDKDRYALNPQDLERKREEFKKRIEIAEFNTF